MEADYFRMLFDYGYWARDRLLATAQGLSDEEFSKPNGFTYGSLQAGLAHTLFAEQLLLTRFLGETPAPTPVAEITSLSKLTSLWG